VSLEALILDVDGTLADTEEAHRRAFNEAFEEHGLDWHWTKQQYAELLRTTGGKERITAFIGGLPLDPVARSAAMARVPALHKTKTDNYMRIVHSGEVPLREGVERLLDEARAAGVVLGIATTTTFDNIKALLQTSLGPHALGRFAVIGAGDQVPCKKPAPDIYKYVLRELGLRPQDCVAIEDSANGLASAKAAGLMTIVTPSYWTEREDFAAADLLLPSLGSLGIREIESQLQAVGKRS
jgi:beta-phosphoglucomutase-like phosphatase (HAD superfamily)